MIFASSANAGESDDFRFARRLQNDGIYIAAAEEYLRFSEKYPDSGLRPSSLFNAGECWMKAGKAAEAMDAFETLLAAHPRFEDACKARYYRGDILRVLKRYRESADEFLMIDEVYPDCPLDGQALLSAGESLLSEGDSHEAASVLRRVTDSGSYPGLQPRAMYSLAVALKDIGRDLEAVAILKKLVQEYSKSPVAALALLRLGDASFENREYTEAERFFREAARLYREDALKEKAVLKILDVTEAMGDDLSLLKEAERFLKEFPSSESRPHIFRKAVGSAWKLGDGKKAVGLIDMWRNEGSAQDSTGEVSLLRGKILAGMGNNRQALSELREFRHTWTRSPMLVEALRLEAGLLMKEGRNDEAAARLQLAVVEGAAGEEKIEILSLLASLSIDHYSDTLSALRYWDMIIAEDGGDDAEEDALWRSAEALERSGKAAEAAGRLKSLSRRFPEGKYAEEAEKRSAVLELSDLSNGDPVSELARLAVSGGSIAEKYINTGIILLDRADRPEYAFSFFSRIPEADLPDSLLMKTLYFKGKAKQRIYDKSLVKGKADKKSREDAIGSWLKAARKGPGTRWGELSHRAYLENRLDEWKLGDQLAKLDEFIGYYNSGENLWWGASRKAELLYGEAGTGKGWAADSSIAVFRSVLDAKAPGNYRKEALLKTGYLLRMKGLTEDASRYLSAFVSENRDDERIAPVLYDLGELHINMKGYKKALDSFQRSLAASPSKALESKSRLRVGDCLYYLRDFSGAVDAYRDAAMTDTKSPLAYEASYRESITLEQLGLFERSDSILVSLSRNDQLSKGLRARILSRFGQKLLLKGEAEKAKILIEELVSLERKEANLSLYGEVLLETGDLEGSVRVFSDVIRFEGVDTCRVLSGRAKARYRMGSDKDGSRDLGSLIENHPDCQEIAGVMLEKGKNEAAAGRCEAAAETFTILRERYPATPPASEALYHFAVCDLKRGGNAEAIDKLNLFLRESPNTVILDQAFFKLASAHYQSGNLNLAAQNYSLAAEASSDDSFIFLAMKNLAMIYQELEEWEKAGEAWYTICERFPGREDIVDLFFNLGFCYGQSGKFEMAWEVYRRIPGIARSEEQKGRAYYWAGISLKNLDRCKEAVREFLRVPYLRTGGMWGITSKLEAAICYEKLGQVEQALEIYERIVSAHGENSDWGSIAKKALDRINGVKEDDAAGKTNSDDPEASGKKDD